MEGLAGDIHHLRPHQACNAGFRKRQRYGRSFSGPDTPLGTALGEQLAMARHDAAGRASETMATLAVELGFHGRAIHWGNSLLAVLDPLQDMSADRDPRAGPGS